MTATATTTLSTAQGQALLDYLMSGETLAPLMGRTLESMETIYHLAYTLYNQAKYPDASRLFTYLMTCNHVDRRFHSGLAACMQMQKRYKEALRYYGSASTLMLTDPEPVLHMAECWLALGDRAQARLALDYGLAQARGHSTHHTFVPRLEALRAFLDEGLAANQDNAAGGDAPATSSERQEKSR